MVQQHDIESVARRDPSQPVEQVSQRRANVDGGRGSDLDREVDVALRAFPAAGVGAEEVGELDLGKRAQGSGQPGNEVGVTVGLHAVGRYHSVTAP